MESDEGADYSVRSSSGGSSWIHPDRPVCDWVRTAVVPGVPALRFGSAKNGVPGRVS